MNKKKLDDVFDWYIAKFDAFNENYKWAACQQFRDNWDINATNFANMLNLALGRHPGGGGLGNLVESGRHRAFSGLLIFAENEPETVRAMFASLFSEGDLRERIERFMQDSHPLVEKYGEKDGYKSYKQDIAAVMDYLACWKPDEYFFYKYTEANKFAKEVAFDGKIEQWPKFSPRVYYRMCNELIEAMRQREDLLRVNATRFTKDSRKLWPDRSLHILAHDVIFCSCEERYYN